MYPPNDMIKCGTGRRSSSLSSSQLLQDDTSSKSINSNTSEDMDDSCEASYDLEQVTNPSYSPNRDPIDSLSPPSTMEGGAVMSHISLDHYFHGQQDQLPYQVPQHDQHTTISTLLCNGGLVDGGATHSIHIPSGTVSPQQPRLPYPFSAFSHHLVDTNHPSSRQLFHQEFMSGQANSTTSPLVHQSSPNRLPVPIQSPHPHPHPHNMNPSDFLAHQVRTPRRQSVSSVTSSLQPTSSVYGGNVFESVLSPAVVDGCHSHQQPFTWYNGTDVPFESLLPSSVSTLFPFPPNPGHYDSTHHPFQFFASPVSTVVNSPTSSTPSLHYLHQHQQPNVHQPQVHQIQHDRPAQFAHPSYLNTRSFHFQAPPNTMPQPGYTGFAAGHPSGQNQKPKKGGRRPKEEQSQLPPEEEEKRKQRRNRNKEAAARCRKRRLDHMNELSDQVADLERKQSNLEMEIDQLQKEKEELEFVLKTHEPACRLRGQLAVSRSTVGQPPAKKFASNHQPAGITVTASSKVFLPPHLSTVKSEAEIGGNRSSMDDDPPLNSGMKNKLAGNWGSSSSINRPDSLRFNVQPDLDSPGIPIQTPSKIFAYDPLNALSMPTGLTPVTSGLTPILSLASAAATLETPTTSVLSSLDGSSNNTTSIKTMQPL